MKLLNNLEQIQEDKNTNLLPENLREGIRCLGINGNFKGDLPSVKLFETIEEMENDSTAKEKDLAMVYRREIQKAQVDSVFSKATFLSTIVLPSAVTSSISTLYRSKDDNIYFSGSVSLNSSRFSMRCSMDSGSITITYESTDGITYTRSDANGEEIDFGTEIYCSYIDMWDDLLGYFIQISGSTFEGIFQYAVNVPDYTYYPIYKNGTASYDGSTIIYNLDEEYTNGLSPLLDYIISKSGSVNGILVLEDYNGEIATKATLYSRKTGIYLDSTGITSIYNNILTQSATTTSQTFTNIYHYDMVADTYTTESITMDVESIEGGGKITILRELKDTYYTKVSTDMNNLGKLTIMTKNNVAYFVSIDKQVQYKLVQKYLHAPTQLTLNNPGQLLPDVIAYGKEGIVTGTDELYNNLEPQGILANVFNLSKVKTTSSSKVYGEINNFFSSQSDSRKLTYVKEDVNGEISIAKVIEKIQINKNQYNISNFNYISEDKTKLVKASSGYLIVYSVETGEELFKNPISVYGSGPLTWFYNNKVYCYRLSSDITIHGLYQLDLDTLEYIKISDKVISPSLYYQQDKYLIMVSGYNTITSTSGCFVYIYNLETGTTTTISELTGSYSEVSSSQVVTSKDTILLYVRTDSNYKVVKINILTGEITTVSSSITLSETTFLDRRGLILYEDDTYYYYIKEYSNPLPIIYKITKETGEITNSGRLYIDNTLIEYYLTLGSNVTPPHYFVYLENLDNKSIRYYYDFDKFDNGNIYLKTVYKTNLTEGSIFLETPTEDTYLQEQTTIYLGGSSHYLGSTITDDILTTETLAQNRGLYLKLEIKNYTETNSSDYDYAILDTSASSNYTNIMLFANPLK